jgi:hypothetical protein
MYAAVPSSTPIAVIAGDVIVGESERSDVRTVLDDSDSLANPKSSTLTVPSGRTLIFAGFKSR